MLVKRVKNSWFIAAEDRHDILLMSSYDLSDLVAEYVNEDLPVKKIWYFNHMSPKDGIHMVEFGND